MTGDCHVRFCERLGGKFPGPTRRSFGGTHNDDAVCRHMRGGIAGLLGRLLRMAIGRDYTGDGVG